MNKNTNQTIQPRTEDEMETLVEYARSVLQKEVVVQRRFRNTSHQFAVRIA